MYVTTAIAMLMCLQGSIPATHIIVDEVHVRHSACAVFSSVARNQSLERLELARLRFSTSLLYAPQC